MFQEITLAIIQAATEFLPISSSGHLALVSNLISQPNLFFFTALHLASLLAVLIFTRKEIFNLLTFKPEYKKLWFYWIIATIPAGVIGIIFQDFIESTFSSLFYVGIGFLFSALILFLTKFSHEYSGLNAKKSLLIGIFQAVAILPGVSRSGMTISAGLFQGLNRETAAKFSFLMFIPVSLGAFLLELKDFYFDSGLLISFIICFILSYVFINLLFRIIKQGKLWWFSIYCLIAGIVSLSLYLI